MKRRIERYLIEASALAGFMFFLAVCGTLLEHPASPIRRAISVALARRSIMAVLAGGYLSMLAYSSWGKRSGAHVNPAVTLAMVRLGRITRRDAAYYILAQISGAILGMAAASWAFGHYLHHPWVSGIVTQSGKPGVGVAFGCEALLSFLLMAVILATLSRKRWARMTGICVGISIALFIIVGGPLSGTSLNPARSLGAALIAGDVEDLWIYMLAPPLGMFAAAEIFWRREIV